MKSSICFLAVLALILPPTVATLDDQVGASIDYGTFQNPSARVRPRFRYWLPDASVDKATVAADIKSVGDVGGGGVEFLGFYDYDGSMEPTPPGADWSTYGFGTQAWQDMFRVALEAHHENKMVMDFPVGPSQGQGVPAEPGDEGLQWDLVPFSVNIPRNGSFEGILPGWGTGEFIGLVSALILNQVNVSLPPSIIPGSPSQPYYLRLIAQESSLTDLTDQVSTQGYISISLPPTSVNNYYQLFIYYQNQPLHKNLIFTGGRKTGTIFDNGSFTVDHYSTRGAQVVTKFWEKYILTNGIKELLMQVGNYGWEDSIEIISNISWTPSVPSRFQDKFGYSLTKYLPMIQWGNNNPGIQPSDPGLYECVLDSEDGGIGYINDFRAVLADGYRDYLETLTNWTNQYLNLQMSAQVSYNLPIDMEANIPFVNAPECESLGFQESVDAYRQFTGPANLVGKRVISNEMGANTLEAYQLQIPHLLWEIHSAFAGGVNQVVLHGQVYTGDYYGTTWPGYSAFAYLFSEMWSHKLPVWDNGLSDVLNYVARLQHILQTGTPKTDVAMYKKVSGGPSFSNRYTFPDLLLEGWTYAYLSPENFVLSQAQVQQCILAPQGPSYKAFVVSKDENLTLDSIRYLQTYAYSGLPIIFSGGVPGFYPSANDNGTADFNRELASLMSTENVYNVNSSGLAVQLNKLGLEPNIRVMSNGTWYPVWREDSKNGIAYAFVFSDRSPSSGNITVASTDVPYFYDAWTGERRPVVHYSRTKTSTIIPLTLSANQTVVIAFSQKPLWGIATPSASILGMPQQSVSHAYTDAQGSTLHLTYRPGESSVTISTGHSMEIDCSMVSAAFELKSWQLIAEHWEAPNNMSSAAVIAEKHNTTHHLPVLQSWLEIPELVNVSGLGYYSTEFIWPPAKGSADGAYMHFGRILNTIRVQVNGIGLLPLDLQDPKVDIGPYLVHGKNEVLVVVPTVMWNYLRSIYGKLRRAGSPPLLSASELPIVPPIDNGLLGPVVLIPYIVVGVTL